MVLMLLLAPLSAARRCLQRQQPEDVPPEVQLQVLLERTPAETFLGSRVWTMWAEWAGFQLLKVKLVNFKADGLTKVRPSHAHAGPIIVD